MNHLKDKTPKAQRLKLNDEDFIIADTHFAHANILKYEDRPFTSVDKMNEGMISRWNDKVGPDDVVYHLGDFSWGGAAVIRSFIERLNGRIVLVRGNHDRARTAAAWRKLGIHKVLDGPVQAISKNIGFVLSHEPIVMPLCYPHRVNVHGHTHTMGGEFTHSKAVSDDHFCVSVELINYAPITIDEMLVELYRGKDTWKKEK